MQSIRQKETLLANRHPLTDFDYRSSAMKICPRIEMHPLTTPLSRLPGGQSCHKELDIQQECVVHYVQTLYAQLYLDFQTTQFSNPYQNQNWLDLPI